MPGIQAEGAISMTYKTLFKCRYFRVEELKERVNGRMATFYGVRDKDAVVVMPRIGNDIILERIRRPVVGKYMVEFPAGLIEKGESPRRAAVREFREETGYTADSMRYAISCYVSPGFITQKLHYFYASGLKAGKPNKEPDEDITLMRVSLKKAQHMIEDGEICDNKTALGIMLLSKVG